MENKEKKKPGPKPNRLKLEGDWKDRIRDALRVMKGKKLRPKGKPKAKRR